MATVVQLDSRKRLNLAPFATSDIYLVTTEQSGRIIPEPAKVVSTVEQAVLDSPTIMAIIDEARSDRSTMSPEQ